MLKLILVALSALLWTGGAHAQPRPINPGDVYVIDGDTIRLYARSPSVRLVGFNAPETGRAACDAERALGVMATSRVRALVDGGDLTFEPLPCACREGTEGTKKCNYGRSCGRLRTAGRDVGETLIAEGLAVPFVCTETSCPKTPRPWCP